METLIIGAGISGLALARALTEKGHDNLVLEATDRVGGVIDTYTPPGTAWQMNYGANTLFVDEEVMGFLNSAGLGPNWAEPSALSKSRFILKGEEYKKLPNGPLSLLFGDFFSWKTKRRLIAELSYKGRGPAHESVYDFFARHFGEEVCDWAVQPFLAGVYAGDARELLIEFVFPKLVELEAKYGSLIRGMRKEGFGAGRRKSISFVMGMRELCEALADMTQAVRGQSPVDRLERLPDGRWRAITESGEAFEARNIVLSVPAYRAAHLLAQHHPDAAHRFGCVHYTELAQVHIGFDSKDIHRPLHGFGGLHPPAAGTFTSGVLWVSSVLPMRAPAGSQLLVAFVGGEGRPSITGMPTEAILDKVEAELRKLYQINAPATVRHLRRWDCAIPQYDRRMLGVAEAAQALEADRLYVQANWVGGVSVQDCIKKALRLAERLGVGV